jgi:hypothetical protein
MGHQFTHLPSCDGDVSTPPISSLPASLPFTLTAAAAAAMKDLTGCPCVSQRPVLLIDV